MPGAGALFSAVRPSDVGAAWRFGAVSLGHLGRVGLDLMLTVLAPNDQPDAGGGSVAERHWRAGFGFHC